MSTDEKDLKHTNGYCIALLIMTFLSFIIGIILMMNGQDIAMELLFYATILIITLILVMDREHLKEIYPERKIFAGITVILVPWYLYQRAKFLKTRQTFLIIWVIMMVLGTAADYVMDKIYGGLPSCGDRDVIAAIEEIVNNRRLGFVSLTNIEEESFDEALEVRVCHGSVTTAYEDNAQGKYQIYWGNGDRSNYVVEIVPVYDYYSY